MCEQFEALKKSVECHNEDRFRYNNFPRCPHCDKFCTDYFKKFPSRASFIIKCNFCSNKFNVHAQRRYNTDRYYANNGDN